MLHTLTAVARVLCTHRKFDLEKRCTRKTDRQSPIGYEGIPPTKTENPTSDVGKDVGIPETQILYLQMGNAEMLRRSSDEEPPGSKKCWGPKVHPLPHCKGMVEFVWTQKCTLYRTVEAWLRQVNLKRSRFVSVPSLCSRTPAHVGLAHFGAHVRSGPLESTI